MNEKVKIHIFYIISILISIIIVLVVVKWGTIEGLVGYIGFAATVTSLAVGILAIVYALYSNSTFSNSSAQLSQSSKEISQTSERFTSSIKDLERSLKD